MDARDVLSNVVFRRLVKSGDPTLSLSCEDGWDNPVAASIIGGSPKHFIDLVFLLVLGLPGEEGVPLFVGLAGMDNGFLGTSQEDAFCEVLRGGAPDFI